MDSEPQIKFPDFYDALYEMEVQAKGRLGEVLVILKDIGTFNMTFMDPERIRQDLEGEAESGRDFLAESNLVVMETVSREAIVRTVYKLDKEGFFRKLAGKVQGES
jgi:hypothetical protein